MAKETTRKTMFVRYSVIGPCAHQREAERLAAELGCLAYCRYLKFPSGLPTLIVKAFLAVLDLDGKEERFGFDYAISIPDFCRHEGRLKDLVTIIRYHICDHLAHALVEGTDG